MGVTIKGIPERHRSDMFYIRKPIEVPTTPLFIATGSPYQNPTSNLAFSDLGPTNPSNMEDPDNSVTRTNTCTPTSPGSRTPPPTSPPPPPPPPPTHPPAALPAIVTPCAACKILRRRCTERCVLAPYFPPTKPAKFIVTHRVFGASNITKFLQDLPESQRADAVATMVYEASARTRDPVYGCAGVICQLQNQVSELQAQLAKAQAELVNLQCQQANLVAMPRMEMAAQTSQPPIFQHSADSYVSGPRVNQSGPGFFEDAAHSSLIWDQMMLWAAT